jgi:hypothetical protein
MFVNQNGVQIMVHIVKHKSCIFNFFLLACVHSRRYYDHGKIILCSKLFNHLRSLTFQLLKQMPFRWAAMHKMMIFLKTSLTVLIKLL